MFSIGRKDLMWLPLLAAIGCAYTGAFLLRYDFVVPASIFSQFKLGLWFVLLVKPPIFWMFRLHANRWPRVGLFDLCRICAANAVASILVAGTMHVSLNASLPATTYVLDCLLCLMAVAALQFGTRVFREVIRPQAMGARNTKSILIYGAGEAGMQLGKEIRAHPRWGANVVGFLDDDPGKRGGTLIGLPVFGSGRDAASVVSRFQRRSRCISEIVIAMPAATGRQMRSAIANCRASGVAVRTLPSVSELLDGKVIRQVREVVAEDLLGRQPVQIEEEKIRSTVSGKVILVTGGCGSIGSEICRQVSRFQPRKLVIFDQAESEMFMLALGLRGRFPGLELSTEVGDVTSAPRVDEVIRRHKVQVIFHAAAYKHVPLMEEHALEAVQNNVMGTFNVALAAHRHDVEQFILISTDKAVNPTSVMGLTKRVAELLVSAMPLDRSQPSTRFASVRFGNVLGSSGSVVQIFRRQIAEGGPVTVTHPEMRRYFMSIAEAVQLVLQASTMGTGSEVFVLDMGEPVLIGELARNMIRLTGLVPDEDIEIRTTGLRPGEKLFEEIHLEDENHLPTPHEKISRFNCRSLSPVMLTRWVDDMNGLLRRRDVEGVVEHMKQIVPEYQGGRGVKKIESESVAMPA